MANRDNSTGLRDLFAPTASHQERVAGLLELGLPPAAVAEAVGTSSSTLRNWRTGRSQPRHEASIVLDDLRATAVALLDSGLSRDEAGAWLMSRDRSIGGRRPIETAAQDPIKVLEAATAFGEALQAPEVLTAGRDDTTGIVDPDGQPLSARSEHRLVSTGVLGPDGQPLGSGSVPFQRLVLSQKKVSDELLARLKAHPEEMRKLDWRAFEELVAELFERDGFEVEMTPLTGDRGVDLFAARKERWGTMLYVVQCKRYTAKIGPSFVREFAWVINRHDANHGVLATTSHFTPGAVAEQQLLPYRMSLADFHVLERWLGGAPRGGERP
jgi:hypothetical protein